MLGDEAGVLPGAEQQDAHEREVGDPLEVLPEGADGESVAVPEPADVRRERVGVGAGLDLERDELQLVDERSVAAGLSASCPARASTWTAASSASRRDSSRSRTTR
jgi:hypothetical protein